MKKILFAIAFVMMISIGANAQKNDGFFRNWDNGTGDRTTEISSITPLIPGGVPGEFDTDQEAPLGSGLLILTALGAGYAVARKKK